MSELDIIDFHVTYSEYQAKKTISCGILVDNRKYLVICVSYRANKGIGGNF